MIEIKDKYPIPWGCHTLLLSILAIGQVNAEVLTADFNGDGREDLVVGVPANDSAGKQNSGSVTVFYGTDRGLPPDADEVFHQDTPGILGIAEANDRFASVVAVGDFNGDGFDDLAAGVPLEDLNGVGPDNRGVDAGAVNVIYGSASGLQVSGNQVFTAGSKDPGYAQSDSAFGEALTSGDFNGVNYHHYRAISLSL